MKMSIDRLNDVNEPLTKARKKYLTKKRKKWNRRILIARISKELTLTHVRKGYDEFWLTWENILDYIRENPGSKRHDMSLDELTNRAQFMLGQDFVIQEEHDRQITRGGISRRWRGIMFRIIDMDALDEFIDMCQEEYNNVQL